MNILQTISETLLGFNHYSVLFRILLAVAAGGLIGSERGRHGRAAGLRTHILVCIGSAVATMVGFYASEYLGCGNDPLRVSAQVVSGIGFLGAGTILTHNHSQVTGLTTAAGLWATASIGIALGCGFYMAAAAAFVIIIFTNTVIGKVERANFNANPVNFYVELDGIQNIESFFSEMNDVFGEMEIVSAKSGYAGHVGIICRRLRKETATDASERAHQLESVVLFVPLTK